MTPERGEPSSEDVLGAFRQVHVTALEIIQAHPHTWSTDPCPTCRSVSTLLQKPFGCVLHTKQQARRPQEGEPCGHPGCLSHVSHPCEGCGRTAGWSREREATT